MQGFEKRKLLGELNLFHPHLSYHRFPFATDLQQIIPRTQELTVDSEMGVLYIGESG
jgi:hypothetical protein